MNGVSEPIACWLERKRRTERAAAAVLALLGLGSGAAVFLLITLLIYSVLSLANGAFTHPPPWVALVAFGLTAAFFARIIKGMRSGLELVLDPFGAWIIKDICRFGPRLLLEGLHQVRRCGDLGELNVAACARALAYLAEEDAAVTREKLMRHCPQMPWARLAAQLALLDGVLFLGEEASRVTLMEPFRLRLRWMLGWEQSSGRRPEPSRAWPEPPPPMAPVNEPENLSAYEILGLSPSASVADIKTAYRKRVKECHPDLFAGMDQQAQALAERWTRALNAAYATLKPRGVRPNPTRQP